MKRMTVALILTAVAMLLTSPAVASGVPSAINLQGRLTDITGNNVADGTYSVEFRIYDDSSGGSVVWSESLPVQVNGGLFTVLIGKGTNFPIDLFSGFAKYFLGITVSPEPELPRIPFTSVAYAFQSEDADMAVLARDLTCVACVKADEVDPSQVQLRVTGTAPANQFITGINQDGTVTSASDSDSAYTAGAGLELNGTKFSIQPDGVTSVEIAENAVGPDQIASDAIVGGLGGDIQDNTITAADLASNSVGVDEIASNAVGAAEIGVGAVGSDEIATDAVGFIEIADDAVRTNSVQDGTLRAVDSRDEPGVASSTEGAAAIIMSGPLEILTSHLLAAPEPGYVLVIATAEVIITHTNGVTSQAIFGVSNDVTLPPNQDVAITVSSTAPSAGYSQAVTVHGLFSAPLGPTVYFLLGDEVGGDFFVTDIQFSLIYFPTSYGTVVSTAAAPSGQLNSTEFSEGGFNLSGSYDAKFQSSVNSDLEARIAKLEEQLRQIATKP